MSCTHLDQVVFTEPPDRVEGCPECLQIGSRWVHLRMCQTCGTVGCCDSSPNQHASKHARAGPSDPALDRAGRRLELVHDRRGGVRPETTMSDVDEELEHEEAFPRPQP
jgi:hypothetical protein